MAHSASLVKVYRTDKKKRTSWEERKSSKAVKAKDQNIKLLRHLKKESKDHDN